MITFRPLGASFALALLVAGSLAPDDATARSRREAARPIAASGYSVDVSHLRAIGLGEMADLVGATVAAGLRDLGTQPGQRVVVRLTGLSLVSYAGADGGGGGGGNGGGGGGSGGNYDYLEGEILTLGPNGEVLSRHPQTASLSASSGGPSYLEGFEQRRAIALSQAFAAWVRRAG